MQPELVNPLNAEALEFYGILMRAHFFDGDPQKSDIYFSKALAVLDHHWGPLHPFQVTIYGIMANLLTSIDRKKDAGMLY